jgi:hypothetical protein
LQGKWDGSIINDEEEVDDDAPIGRKEALLEHEGNEVEREGGH